MKFRHMPFGLTADRLRDQTQTVTRRMGWKAAHVGQVVWAVDRMRDNRICQIRFVDVRCEPLRRLLDDRLYGLDEIEKEGLKDHPQLGTPQGYLRFFLATHAHQCQHGIDEIITRIEFEYVPTSDVSVS